MKKILLPFSLTFILLSCSPKVEQRYWKVYYDLGTAAFTARNYSEAIANFHKALRVNSNEPRIWNSLGLAYMEAKEYEKAEESFRKALSIKQNYSEAKKNLGVLYYKLGKYKEALKYLQEAAGDEYYEKKHEAFYYLAKVYKAKGDFKNYVKYLEKAVAYNPNFVQAQIELAQAYEEVKRYDEAEKIYKGLILNGFNEPFFKYKLAEVYYKRGDYKRAKDIIKDLLYKENLTPEQKERVKELLTKVLLAQQRKLIIPKMFKYVKKEVRKERYYAVQLGAFSTRERAKKLIEELKNKGLKDLKILPTNGVYKVIYGKFKTPEEASRAKEEVKKLGIYGFVVEIK